MAIWSKGVERILNRRFPAITLSVFEGSDMLVLCATKKAQLYPLWLMFSSDRKNYFLKDASKGILEHFYGGKLASDKP